jgi:hypothetical protein
MKGEVKKKNLPQRLERRRDSTERNASKYSGLVVDFFHFLREQKMKNSNFFALAKKLESSLCYLFFSLVSVVHFFLKDL